MLMFCHLGMDEFTNIFLDDNQYDVIIGNFLGCSCFYFVRMLVGSLGGRGAHVQCEHMYHIFQAIMFSGFIEEFIHYYMWNWDEVKHLL
jgi:hypothetical protein